MRDSFHGELVIVVGEFYNFVMLGELIWFCNGMYELCLFFVATFPMCRLLNYYFEL